MKQDNELVIDLIVENIEKNSLLIKEYERMKSNDESNADEILLNIVDRKQRIIFLKKTITSLNTIKGNHASTLVQMVKSLEKSAQTKADSVLKYNMLKSIYNEYKEIIKKIYKNNNQVGVKGIFNNKLFCKVIKDRIAKLNKESKFMKEKNKDMIVFLNSLLIEMEQASNPLETLNHKMKMYKKYKDKECVKVNKENITKIKIIKNILEEYMKRKKMIRSRRCECR